MRGQRSPGRGVSEAQTGGVGGGTDGGQRRRGGPRQISQRKLQILTCINPYFIVQDDSGRTSMSWPCNWLQSFQIHPVVTI